MLLAVHPFSSECHDFVDLDEKMGAIALSWIFLSSRIGFVLTVSATWQIARSFGKQHQRVGFIYTNTEPQIQENMKTGLAYMQKTHECKIPKAKLSMVSKIHKDRQGIIFMVEMVS